MSTKIELTDQGIVIGGEMVKLRFSLSVLEKFRADHNFTTDQVLQNMPDCLNSNLLNVVDLMHDALKYSCKRDSIPCDITWDDVECWFTDNAWLRNQIIDVWNSQLPPVVEDKKKEGVITEKKKN